MKLTTATVRTQALPAGKRETIFFDDDIPGFGLRVREGGSRNFVFQYKLGAKQRRMALGKATPERVADVRNAADKLYARVKLGEDPASDKATAQRQASETLGTIADDFLDGRRGEYWPDSFKEIERHFKVLTPDDRKSSAKPKLTTESTQKGRCLTANKSTQI